MDDLTIRPRDSTSGPGPRRRDSAARAEPTPAQATEPEISAAPKPPASDPRETFHEYHLDPQSQQVVDREREVSGRKPRRMSDQALLRMRVYGRALAHDEGDGGPDDHTDLEA